MLKLIVLSKILDKYNLQEKIKESLSKDLNDYFLYQEEHSRFLNLMVESISKEIEEYKVKLLENQDCIIQKSKMATIGEVTATLSHEINNQLMILSGNCQLIEMLNKDIKNDTIQYAIETNLKTLEDISILIKNIKKFSYHTKEKVSYALDSPQLLVDQTLNVCNHFLSKSRVKVLTDKRIDKNEQVQIASSEVGQVLLNLIKNAYDHASNQKEEKDMWISIDTEKSDSKIKIIVSNGGELLAKEVKEKLFTPFFTTKEIGKGTGIGLSLSNKIMASLSGKVYYDDSLNKISFIIEFPLKSSLSA